MVILADGSLWGWGNNESGQIGAGEAIRKDSLVHVMDDVVAVSTGGSYTMAIRADGSLWGWGGNWDGRVGHIEDAEGFLIRRIFYPVHIMDDVVEVVAGEYNTMAVRSDGSLWAWGEIIADGRRIQTSIPIKIMENILLPGR